MIFLIVLLGEQWSMSGVFFFVFFVVVFYVEVFGVFDVYLDGVQSCSFVEVVNEVEFEFEDEVEEFLVLYFDEDGFVYYFGQFDDEVFVLFLEVVCEFYCNFVIFWSQFNVFEDFYVEFVLFFEFVYGLFEVFSYCVYIGYCEGFEFFEVRKFIVFFVFEGVFCQFVYFQWEVVVVYCGVFFYEELVEVGCKFEEEFFVFVFDDVLFGGEVIQVFFKCRVFEVVYDWCFDFYSIVFDDFFGDVLFQE